jgi:hypothetical protein
MSPARKITTAAFAITLMAGTAVMSQPSDTSRRMANACKPAVPCAISPDSSSREHFGGAVVCRSGDPVYHDGEVAAAHGDEKRLERDGCRVIKGEGLAVELIENPRDSRLWRGRVHSADGSTSTIYFYWLDAQVKPDVRPLPPLER